MPDNAPEDNLRERRIAVVREHMGSENAHDFDLTMTTFDHPRYEIIPTGEIYDGAKRSRHLLQDHSDSVSRPAQREHDTPSRR